VCGILRILKSCYFRKGIIATGCWGVPNVAWFLDTTSTIRMLSQEQKENTEEEEDSKELFISKAQIAPGRKQTDG
jgi:hypothetical protein